MGRPAILILLVSLPFTGGAPDRAHPWNQMELSLPPGGEKISYRGFYFLPMMGRGTTAYSGG